MQDIKNLSKTRVKEKIMKKTNPEVIATLRCALKQKNWLSIAKIISNSTRRYSKINLSKIEKEAKTGDTILIVGKVLSSGDLSKKVRICSLSISKSALDKLKKTKSEYASILDEIMINPKAEGLKIIR